MDMYVGVYVCEIISKKPLPLLLHQSTLLSSCSLNEPKSQSTYPRNSLPTRLNSPVSCKAFSRMATHTKANNPIRPFPFTSSRLMHSSTWDLLAPSPVSSAKRKSSSLSCSRYVGGCVGGWEGDQLKAILLK